MGAAQSSRYSLLVRFPRGQVRIHAGDAPTAIIKRFPGAKNLALVTVELAAGANIQVDGFGMPYANPEDPDAEGWVNGNMPIVPGITLLGFLQSRTFRFLVPVFPSVIDKVWCEKALPAPFSYPYGIEHRWPVDDRGADDLSRYSDLLDATKSPEQFRTAYRSVPPGVCFVNIIC